MSTISVYRIEFLTFSSNGSRPRRKFQRFSYFPAMKVDYKSFQSVKKEEHLIKHQTPSIPLLKNPRACKLKFDRLQPSEEELDQYERLNFGKFVAREALLDEELWVAAWLRAESHWENRQGESDCKGGSSFIQKKYVDNFKRKFAEQEFNAIKRRCREKNGQKYACLVTVKKEDRNVQHTVLKSVVGTLDFSIQYLLHGESFPGERVKPFFCHINRTDLSKYVYVSNLCIAKSARRQGIGSNMLYFAIESARSSGVELVYVHVDKHNAPALELYEKVGFEIVEAASCMLLGQQMYLLRFKT